VQIFLGHSKIETTVKYLGVEVEDALSLAEATEVQAFSAGRFWPARSTPPIRRELSTRLTKRIHLGDAEKLMPENVKPATLAPPLSWTDGETT